MEAPRAQDVPRIDGGPPALRRWLVVVTAGLGMYLMALDISVNVALPTITDHFRTDIQTIQWIIVSFVATRAGLAVAAGSFGDLFGLKRVYLVGALLYGVAVVLIAFSPSLGPVFGFRVLQGVGAGSLYAVSPAIAGQVFTADRRGLAMGVTTASWALGSISGTVGMGFLVDVFGWEAVFLARAPFCLLALALGLAVLRDAQPGQQRPSFDAAGAVTLVGSMVSIVLALHLGGRGGWGSPLPILFLAAFPVLLFGFLYAERKARWPVLDLGLLRMAPFLAACSSMFFVQMGAFVIWFVFPFYVADGLERGPLALGVIMAVMAACMSLFAPVAGWLSDRVSARWVGGLGALTVAGGLLWMGQLDQGSSLPRVGVQIGVVGLGLGGFQAAAYSLLVKSLPADRMGTGAGSISLAQAMGSVVAGWGREPAASPWPRQWGPWSPWPLAGFSSPCEATTTPRRWLGRLPARRWRWTSWCWRSRTPSGQRRSRRCWESRPWPSPRAGSPGGASPESDQHWAGVKAAGRGVFGVYYHAR